MASRNTKLHVTKPTGSRSTHSAPGKPSKNSNSQQARNLQNSARSLAHAPHRKHSCTACPKSFSTQTELSQHRKDKHGTITQPARSAYKHIQPETKIKWKAITFKCPSCAKDFSTSHELVQHRKDKHQFHQSPTLASMNRNQQTMFSCSFCPSRFSGSRELTQHTKDKHKIEEANFTHAIKSLQATKSINRVPCTYCDRTFSSENELSQHQRDKHKNNPPKDRCKTAGYANSCPLCPSHFTTPEALLQHNKDKHLSGQFSGVTKNSNDKRKIYSNNFQCSNCPKIFSTDSQLVQHVNDKHRSNCNAQITQVRKHDSCQATAVVKSDQLTKPALKRNERKKVIDEYYAKKVDIDKDEKKISVRLVNETLSKIMGHVNGQKGGDIYCPNHIKAGSFPVNTKIGKPDEFDTNICLKLGQQDVKVSRGKTIRYSYGQSEHATNMNVKCELDRTRNAVKVPNNYAVASTSCDKLPEELLHGKDIVPREIRYDLYHKIKTAKDSLGLNYVDLSRNAHGPALTLTIHPPKRCKIQHHISVDITLSLPSNIPISQWPRRATKQAFSPTLIKDVKETGTHLVPKKDELWAVSYSKAERALFSRLDEGNGCRKFVYKMLKKYMQSCKSRSKTGLTGLSSHILKTQILWSCERHLSPEFWHYNNRDVCLIETLGDLEKTLRRGQLSDYFDTSVDILKGKDADVCSELANYLRDKKCELEE